MCVRRMLLELTWIWFTIRRVLWIWSTVFCACFPIAIPRWRHTICIINIWLLPFGWQIVPLMRMAAPIFHQRRLPEQSYIMYNIQMKKWNVKWSFVEVNHIFTLMLQYACLGKRRWWKKWLTSQQGLVLHFTFSLLCYAIYAAYIRQTPLVIKMALLSMHT